MCGVPPSIAMEASHGHSSGATAADKRHVTRAVEYLARLRPQERPGTAQKLERSLQLRGCCAYHAPVPVVAVAACLWDLVGKEDTRLSEALAPFKFFRPSCEAELSLAASAAARVACSLGGGQLGLGPLLARHAWAECRVEPRVLMEALVAAGAVLKAGTGRLGYSEDALAELGSQPCTPRCEARVHVESVELDLGGPFEREVRARELSEAKGGLTAVVQRWLGSTCEACLLQGRPRIDFARKGHTLSFAFAPGTPELASRVLAVARMELQESFSPGITSASVPVAVHHLFACKQSARLRTLGERLRCSLSVAGDPPGVTVVTRSETAASLDEICVLVELFFGEGSVVPCGSLPRECLGSFIGRGGQCIAALELELGVELSCADGPEGEAQIFGCLSPASLCDSDLQAAGLRARLAEAPGHVAAALQRCPPAPAEHGRTGGLPRAPRTDPPQKPAAALRRVALHDELYPLLESFDDANLDESLLRGVYSYGLERPSAIQQRAILPIINGRDVIAQAQSGTGKTAAFVIGVLQRVDYTTDVCQALILAPSRELALQTQKVVLALGEYLGVRCHCCIGGTSVRADIDQLRRGQQVVVGMPGRVFDMISKRHLRVGHVASVVLDEADEMLRPGMREQVYDIFRALPRDVAVAAFSATMLEETLDVSNRFMCNPVRILVRSGELCLPSVSQFYVAVDREEWKLDTVIDLYEPLIRAGQLIVFCGSRRKVDFVTDQLSQRWVPASCLHAELDQRERDLVMRQFRSGTSRLLVATDSLARGIDIQGVTAVVSYDVPARCESYLHRVGRCGRFGRKGLAVSLVTDPEMSAMRDIERHFETRIEELPCDFESLL